MFGPNFMYIAHPIVNELFHSNHQCQAPGGRRDKVRELLKS